MAIHTTSAAGMGASTLSGSTITNTGMNVQDHMQVSQDFLALAGVVGMTDCQAVQNGTPNRSVNINPGTGYIKNVNWAGTSVTVNEFFRYINDAAFNVAINTNASGNPRITSIFAKFLPGTTPDGTASNVTTFVAVDGTAAASPVAPSAPSDGNSYQRIADITCANGFSSITNANIVDKRAIASLLTINGPEGFLINGQIVSTFAGNNVTVSILTMAGNTPTTDEPVVVRLGNAIYKITAALTVTAAAGTNWFQSGDAILATQTIEYFVYLGYNTTDGITIGFARIPGANYYGDFSATSTNSKFCKISNIAHASNFDRYVVVGRFNAVLGATASFNWSAPGTSLIIQYPIFETTMLNYAPGYNPQGGTFTGTTPVSNTYKISRDLCFVEVAASGTVGASVTEFRPDLPFFPLLSFAETLAGRISSQSVAIQLNKGLGTAGGAQVSRYDGGSFVTGVQGLMVSGSYRI